MSDAILRKFKDVLPHFNLAMEMARVEIPDGTIELMIAAIAKDGSGKTIVRFNCEEFFEDLAELCGVKEFPSWIDPADVAGDVDVVD